MPYSRNRLLTRVVAPIGEPLTLAEAKLYLRVDHNQDDTLISDLIVTARMIAEEWLKRSLITQSWKLAYDASLSQFTSTPLAQDDFEDVFGNVIRLAMGPVTSVTEVAIVSRDGTTQTVDEDNYYLNAARDELVLTSVVSDFRTEITYEAGYGDAADVPKPIKQGILSHIASMYDHRGENTDIIPAQAIALYMPFREVRL